MPWVSRTPTASPVGCTATRTVIGLSGDTSCRSTWSSFSVTGSNCMARMIAMRLPESPSNLIVSSWVVRPWPTSMRRTALGSTVTGSVLAPP